ncbi:DUF3164 family protein [Patescibacteria group bacterium]|nr:DUF3164 family protein [Desulfocapsa sp.]MBU3983275.1 DUF3164 family protein [Pseudomonadota bacterium]MBU4027228.1 DUF3164 family protein [Patescibacteria group bacterium]MCG2743202.1 DUF3164 family protein [Desulfobacteraceae bacterium]MBU4396218.1 DUF3164 family protein [Pseudomonadota bacterium]
MDWRKLLRKAIFAEGSQGKVAKALGYSPATISQTVAGIYPGDTAGIAQKVMEIYGGKIMQEVPSGYMVNGVGHLVPIESIKEIDLARDEFVKGVVAKAGEMSEILNQFKGQLAGDMQAFLELSAEKYGADLGGARGNLSLTSFDGRFKVLRAVSERLDFDERLQAAKGLVDACLREWSKDSGPELRTLIDNAFQVDKKGRINAKRILSLRALKIEHPIWKQAMDAIADAVTVVGSSTYYRIYERDDEGNYQQISLDFSGV